MVESQTDNIPEWETPMMYDIGVSAEASAYVDVLEFDDA